MMRAIARISIFDFGLLITDFLNTEH